MRFRCSYSNWGFWWWCWQMCRWTMAFPLHMHNGFPTKRIEQMILTLWNDFTVIFHALWGGKYIRTAHTNLGAVVWVSGTEQLGLSISHRPSTPAILVPLVEQSISRKNWMFYLSICTYPDPFEECFSQYDLSCLTVSLVGQYMHHLWPSIEWGTDHSLL